MTDLDQGDLDGGAVVLAVGGGSEEGLEREEEVSLLNEGK